VQTKRAEADLKYAEHLRRRAKIALSLVFLNPPLNGDSSLDAYLIPTHTRRLSIYLL